MLSDTPYFDIHLHEFKNLEIDSFRKFLNFTDHEKYIVQEVKRFSTAEWFRQQKGSFASIFAVPFTEILTNRGVAFTFNILNFDEIITNQ